MLQLIFSDYGPFLRYIITFLRSTVVLILVLGCLEATTTGVRSTICMTWGSIRLLLDTLQTLRRWAIVVEFLLPWMKEGRLDQVGNVRPGLDLFPIACNSLGTAERPARPWVGLTGTLADFLRGRGFN